MAPGSKESGDTPRMYITTVMPLLKGGALDELSYFSKNILQTGSIVSIPIRGKRGHAIILSSRNAEEDKLSIKRGSFSLRKILSTKGVTLFHKPFIDAIVKIAQQYGTSIGPVIRSLVPQYVLESTTPCLEASQLTTHVLKPEVYAYEAPWKERVATYQRLIRTSFAKNKSIVVIAPTIEEVRILEATLSKGVEHRVVSLTGELSKKEYLKRWHESERSPETLALIGTPSLLSLPRSDIGTIVVDRESARSFTLPQRPYLSIPTVAIQLGKMLGAEVLLGDEVLSVTTAHLLTQGLAESYEDFATTRKEISNVSILDTRRKRDLPQQTFSSISPHLAHALKNAISEGLHSFIFVARKGLGNAIVCKDCGARVSCLTCGGVVTLREIARKRIFYCNLCESGRSAHEKCKFCDSWNLVALGIGSMRVRDDLIKLVGKELVFVLDSENAKTHAGALALKETWRNTKGSILIGTELALPYIRDGVDLAGVASLDSLFAIPEWRTTERIFSIITTLANLSKTLLIQTRQSADPALVMAVQNQVREFRERELSFRKQFSYPPFSTLVTLTLVGSSIRVEKEVTELMKLCTQWNPARHSTGAKNGKVRVVILLKVDPVVPSNLLALLRSLPPYISIAQNPESTY